MPPAEAALPSPRRARGLHLACSSLHLPVKWGKHCFLLLGNQLSLLTVFRLEDYISYNLSEHRSVTFWGGGHSGSIGQPPPCPFPLGGGRGKCEHPASEETAEGRVGSLSSLGKLALNVCMGECSLQIVEKLYTLLKNCFKFLGCLHLSAHFMTSTAFLPNPIGLVQ